MIKIGFIGCGNMGGAIASAVCKAVDPSSVAIANRTREKAEKLAKQLECSAASNEEVFESCDYIFLGVKPQMMEGMLAGVKDILARRKDSFVLISMAAGLSMEKIQAMAGGPYPVIRIMPNTPVAIGKGMTTFCTEGVSAAEEDFFLAMMEHSGKLEKIDESLMDAATSVAGCGPAFVYLFIKALAEGGVKAGLSREQSLQLAAQTAAGAAELLMATGKDPEQLKIAVCSPGGSTIEGVHVLEEGPFNKTVVDAVLASFEKNKKLGK